MNEPKIPDEAETELVDLTIKEGSGVDQGDNKGAHVVMLKNKDDEKMGHERPRHPRPRHKPAKDDKDEKDEKDEKDGDPKAGKGRWLWEAVKGFFASSSSEKMEFEPPLPSEIVREREFRDEFSKLRGAFLESVEMILDFTPPEEAGPKLNKTAQDFDMEMRKLTGEIGKVDSVTAGKLSSMLDDLHKSVSIGGVKSKDGMIDGDQLSLALKAIEEFDLKMMPTEAKVSKTETNDLTFETVIEALSDEKRAVVIAAVKAAESTAVETAAKKAADEIDAAKAKANPEVSDGEKAMKARVDALEADNAKMRDERETSDFTERAKVLLGEKVGLNAADVGSSLRAAFKVSDAEGEKLEQHFKALVSQAEKGALFTEVGSIGSSAQSSSAHGKLVDAAKSLQEAAAHAGEKLDEHAAYVKAMDLHPALAEEAVAG